jgi:hypothetical protein
MGRREISRRAPALWCCSSPISIAGFLTEPVGSAFSRYFEHQADVYGQEAIHGIVADPQKTAVAAFKRWANPGSKIPIRIR